MSVRNACTRAAGVLQATRCAPGNMLVSITPSNVEEAILVTPYAQTRSTVKKTGLCVEVVDFERHTAMCRQLQHLK